jgi:hypothetical protein
MATPPTFTTGAVLTAAQMNKVGLWLVDSNTFTTQAAVNIDNVFTADFKYYKAFFNVTTHSTTLGYQIKFRTGGVTNSTANYAYVATSTSSSSGASANTFGRTATVAPLTFTTVGEPFMFELKIYDPFNSSRTYFWFEGQPAVANREQSNGTFNANQSFDGLSIIATAGNITGSYNIYGYNS